MHGLESLVVQDGLLGACELEVMEDVALGLLGAESGHVVAHGDALVEGLHDGKFHDSAQIGLPGEDEDERVVGVHFEVGQKPEFLQGAGLEGGGPHR